MLKAGQDFNIQMHNVSFIVSILLAKGKIRSAQDPVRAKENLALIDSRVIPLKRLAKALGGCLTEALPLNNPFDIFQGTLKLDESEYGDLIWSMLNEDIWMRQSVRLTEVEREAPDVFEVVPGHVTLNISGSQEDAVKFGNLGGAILPTDHPITPGFYAGMYCLNPNLNDRAIFEKFIQRQIAKNDVVVSRGAVESLVITVSLPHGLYQDWKFSRESGFDGPYVRMADIPSDFWETVYKNLVQRKFFPANGPGQPSRVINP